MYVAVNLYWGSGTGGVAQLVSPTAAVKVHTPVGQQPVKSGMPSAGGIWVVLLTTSGTGSLIAKVPVRARAALQMRSSGVLGSGLSLSPTPHAESKARIRNRPGFVMCPW